MSEETQIAETLDETLRRKAAEWTTSDLEAIVAGMIEIRDRWNVAQAQGKRTLVRAKSVGGAAKPKSKGKFAGMGASLRKVKL